MKLTWQSTSRSIARRRRSAQRSDNQKVTDNSSDAVLRPGD
jgi:hypothetical protein